jgi:hypothetical protein
MYATFAYIPAYTTLESTIASGDCRSSGNFRKKAAIGQFYTFKKIKKGAAPERAAP